ncbi:MAG: 1-(5-phosphoribosyl)-5-[Clostridia bacterium]|nr:1-(5-phosphoribosyl)-5-[(5-phosphoribosylamino)methylideneamino]imidazole-4-carboxamide isomerase [Clostridia bacterium]
MIILPAIDIRGGQAVRLLRGEYSDMTVYSSDPVAVDEGFSSAGAGNLHVVDLDGALSGETDNYDIIRRIIEKTGMSVEVGGGIRDDERIEKYLAAGAERVILGTAAVENPDFLREAVKKYGRRIAIGVDIKGGKVATHGWTRASGDALEFIAELEKIGVGNVICTDVSRDGALSGTNIELYSELKERFSLNVTASGGITDVGELVELKKIGVFGAILGKALYDGKISLSAALETEKL